MFPEFRYRRPPPSYSSAMQEYNSMIESLRNQGVIPQTPPPQYKLNASIRRTGNSAIHPARSDNVGAEDAPPMYDEHDNQDGNQPCYSVSDEFVITNEELGNSELARHTGCIDVDELREDNPHELSLSDQGIPATQEEPCSQQGSADLYYREFRLSLGEVTHL